MRIIKKFPLIHFFYGFVVNYPAPTNLSYLWNFGILAFVCLVIQLITGIALAMHYIPHIDLAFISVEHIMRDVNYGWALRYIHANGASMFFLVVYLHTLRGLYFGSFTYPREILWIVGVAILFIMILTAFMGYVLPWGQMSFWAATVITNLTSAIPVLGESIVLWLWGGFAVDQATLNRFFSFHYLFPFVLIALAAVHLLLLHETGSNNPLGIGGKTIIDKIPFTPYFTYKDIHGTIIFFIVFTYFVFFNPNLLGHSDNYIPANPLVTPTHIVPEWYFLPFYGILRSIPNKLGGVMVMVAAILILMALPFLFPLKVRSIYFRPFYKYIFWFFMFCVIFLGWIGGKPIISPYYEIGQMLTVFYFMFFMILLPLAREIEYVFWDYSLKVKPRFENTSIKDYKNVLITNSCSKFEKYNFSNFEQVKDVRYFTTMYNEYFCNDLENRNNKNIISNSTSLNKLKMSNLKSW